MRLSWLMKNLPLQRRYKFPKKRSNNRRQLNQVFWKQITKQMGNSRSKSQANVKYLLPHIGHYLANATWKPSGQCYPLHHGMKQFHLKPLISLNINHLQIKSIRSSNPLIPLYKVLQLFLPTNLPQLSSQLLQVALQNSKNSHFGP